MKRVLIFSLAYFPHVGGAEVAIKEITDRIASSDITFDLITLRMDPRDVLVEMVGNVRVHRVIVGSGYFGKALYPIIAAMCAWRLHRQQKYDGFWAMMGYMVFPIVLLRSIGVRVPYVVTLQEGDTYDHVFGRIHIRMVMPLLRYGFRNARVVQTISHFLATWARELGAREPVIIPNGVDAKKFSGEALPHEGTVLITTSRLVHKNAVDDVIRALPAVPCVHFRVIGTGPDEQMLRALAKDLKVEARVTFAGYLPNAELPAELHAADIFVRPSRSEGFGISFIEAFAAGIPVIATQEGGIADFLTPETGWPVSKDSPKEIAAAIKDILAHPDQTKKVVASAQTLAGEKYDWNIIVKEMYEKVFAIVLT